MEGRRALARLVVTSTLVLVCAACVFGDPERQVLEAREMDAEGSHLQLTVASCNGGPTAEVDEREDRVVVRVTGGSTNDDCADGVCIVLEQPLDGRALIDAATGAEVRVAEGQGTLVGCPLME
jgi:hypothetical protein